MLKDLELQVLLVASGGKGMFGFRSTDNVDESRIPYLIHEMARKEVVEEKDGRLYVKEPYRSVVMGLKEAKACLLLRGNERKRSAEYLYFGTGIIRVQDSINDKNAVKLQSLTEEQCIELLNRHFIAENSVTCPMELIKDGSWEDAAHCEKIVELYETEGLGVEVSPCSWNLYEGRYRNFIKIINSENVIYRGYEEWDSAEIIETIRKKIGGRYDDIS